MDQRKKQLYHRVKQIQSSFPTYQTEDEKEWLKQEKQKVSLQAQLSIEPPIHGIYPELWDNNPIYVQPYQDPRLLHVLKQQEQRIRNLEKKIQQLLSSHK